MEGSPLEVLYVDADPSARERVASAPEEIAITAVDGADAALDRLGETDCLVVADALADGDPATLVETARNRRPDLPIVLYPRDGDGRLARAVRASEPTGYLPQDGTESDPDLYERIEAAVAASEHRRRLERDTEILDALQDNLTVSTYVKDADGRYLWAADIEDAPDPEEMIGKTDPEAFPYDDLARQAYEDDMQVIESGEPIVDKEEHIEGEEWERWLETTKIPWVDEDDTVRGLVGTSVFVDERKELETELEEQTRRLEQFASYISHDLRNPLNVARGYLELGRETGEVEPLEEVEDSLDRIEEIVEDVVALAREEGISSPTTRPLLTEVVREAWETVQGTDATLRTEVPQEARIVAGETQLQQLLENLFRNAVEHAGADATVEVGLLEEGFYVADDGPGIPPEEREAVLEYGHTTGSGSGAGLAIVSEIAEAHDWTLSIAESDEGGARFEFGDCLLLPHPDRLVESGRQVDLEASVDVGDPLPGETHREGGTWTLRAAGEDVWGDYDQHRFAYARVSGDARIVARVTHLDAVHEFSKAGVTIRDEPEAGSSLGHVGMTGENGSEVLWRPSRGERVHSKFPADDVEPPYWYRLDRVGDLVTCSVSSDGEDWQPVDQRRIDVSGTVCLGLAVCSHDPETRCTGRFDRVTVIERED